MKLYAYGDSWTEGQGCRLDDESKLKDRMILKDFRNKYSWPIKLANKLGCDHENNGWSGRANNLIFNDVISDLRNGKSIENLIAFSIKNKKKMRAGMNTFDDINDPTLNLENRSMITIGG